MFNATWQKLYKFLQKNGFLRICSLWKLDVLVFALTPSSIASKPSACQSRQRVRSDSSRQKPTWSFSHRMCFIFSGGIASWESQAVLYRTLLTSVNFYFYFSSFALPCQFRTARTRRQVVPFPSINATPSLFYFFNFQTYTVLNAYSSFSRASFRNNSPSSQSVALCLFFVTWTQRCVCGSSIGGSLPLLCSWLLWLSNSLTKKKKNKKENVV